MREYALKPELVEVEVDTAEYEEVIKGVLKFLFESLPRSVRSRKYEADLHANGFATASALSVMGQADLEGIGVLAGHAKQVLRAVRAVEPPYAGSPAMREAARSGSGGANESRGRGPTLREFPRSSTATGYPELTSWDAYVTGVLANVRDKVEPSTVDEMVYIHKNNKRSEHSKVSERDAATIFDVLVNNGSSSMSDELLTKQPMEVRMELDGIAVFLDIQLGVHAVSDDAVGVLQEWF